MIQILRILYHGLPGSPYHCTIATMPIMDSVRILQGFHKDSVKESLRVLYRILQGFRKGVYEEFREGFRT